MNTYNRTGTAALLAATILIVAATALATPGSSIISMDMVKVGDAGNAADSATGNIYGAVSYEYQIGKYEVTNAQYAAFLNAVAKTDTYGLYNADMANTFGGIGKSGDAGIHTYTVKAGWDDKAVNFVSFYDAARFANWLTNGETESGLYEFSGATTITSVADHASSSGWAVASENEWYKAAYYNGNDASTYRMYPVTTTLSQITANYYNGNFLMPGGNYIADVDYFDGVAGANSYYGTYQQGGNMREWTDTLIDGEYPVLRGGSFATSDSSVAASARLGDIGASEFYGYGFRVVLLSNAAVPEPRVVAGAMGLAVLAVGVWVRRGRRIRSHRPRLFQPEKCLW